MFNANFSTFSNKGIFAVASKCMFSSNKITQPDKQYSRLATFLKAFHLPASPPMR